MRSRQDIRKHLPLRPVEYQVLTSLSRGPLHGWAVLQEIEAGGEGVAVPGLATLYRALRRLRENGLLEDAGEETVDDDDRRRVLRLTPTGWAVLAAETRRLRGMVHAAELALEAGGGP